MSNEERQAEQEVAHLSVSSGHVPNPGQKSQRPASWYATREKIRADNAALVHTRNARRWKAERDPVEYERQKAGQREEYAARQASQGKTVRPYQKITGETAEARKNNRKSRHAEKEQNRLESMTPDQRQANFDAKVDARWLKRRRDNGKDEALIQAEYAVRLQERVAKRAAEVQIDAEEAEMKANPTYAMF